MKIPQSDIAAKLETIISSWRLPADGIKQRAILYPVGENCIWSYGITERGTFCFYLESPVQFGCGKQLCTKNIQSLEQKIGLSLLLVGKER